MRSTGIIKLNFDMSDWHPGKWYSLVHEKHQGMATWCPSMAERNQGMAMGRSGLPVWNRGVAGMFCIFG